MFRTLIFILFITLLSSCSLFPRIQKDESGDYVTLKGKRYSYFHIDEDRGYIINESGKKVILIKIKAAQIKTFK